MASAFNILHCEPTSAFQPQPERRKVAFTTQLKYGLPSFAVRFTRYGHFATNTAVRWERARRGRGHHPRQPAHTVQHLSEECSFLIGRVVSALWQWEPSGKNVVWIEPEVDALEREQRSHHQACTHQEQDR